MQLSHGNLRTQSAYDAMRAAGYALVDHSAETQAAVHKLGEELRQLKVAFVEDTKRPLDPTTHLLFEKIFQRLPTKSLNPNVGDGKRSSCTGFPTKEGVQWCDMGIKITADIIGEAGLSSPCRRVLQNSLLRTEEGSEFQVGHFDLPVPVLPTPRSPEPSAVIALTPLFTDSSLRILPFGAIDRIPTQQEFNRLARVVPVRYGQTLLMRYDMAHSGTDADGMRLHTIYGFTWIDLSSNTSYLLNARREPTSRG